MDRRLDINLLPPEFQPQPAVRWHPIFLTALYALAALLIIYVVVGSVRKITALKTELARTNDNIQRLQPFADAYDLSEKSIKSLENLKQLFVYLDEQYVDWPLFFYHLEPNLPKGVWLTSVSADVDTKAPAVKQATPANTPAGTAQPAAGGAAQPAPAAGGQAGAPAQAPAQPTVPAPPLHTGEITIAGVVNGYSLTPLTILLKNLQQDPFFVNAYIKDISLDESDLGVTRSFSMVVTMKDPKQTAEEEAAKKASSSSDKPTAAEGGQAK